jgi:energy-coupling factor transport system permease protein
MAPGSKLALAALIALGALLAARPLAALALALLCCGLYAAARLGWRALRQDVAIVVLHAPLVVAVFLWRDGLAGVSRALLVSARLSLASLPGLWVQRTTRVTDLAASLRRVLPARLAFVVAMSLRFLPILARDAREIYLLQRLRGARLGARHLVNPLHWGEACHCLAVPLLIRALHLADQVAVAAQQRGVGGSSNLCHSGCHMGLMLTHGGEHQVEGPGFSPAAGVSTFEARQEPAPVGSERK